MKTVSELESAVGTRCISFNFNNSRQLAKFCGPLNEHLKQIENNLEIKILNRGEQFSLSGIISENLDLGILILRQLYTTISEHEHIDANTVHLLIREILHEPAGNEVTTSTKKTVKHLFHTIGNTIRIRGINQQKYIKTIFSNDINFGVGPAGTGKTFLAVACAIKTLEEGMVQRILLTRPAVEAGEKLGFLPGDPIRKIDPYLRPLYDSLYDILGYERTCKLIEKNIIEVAPLAYMRGRTLDNSFVILDESQNATIAQMKMFLTRIGFDSKAVITGDITQVDLPDGTCSGLQHAVKVLQDIKGIGLIKFTSKDVVRHALVKKIIDAYENYEIATGHN